MNALHQQKEQQDEEREAAGKNWKENGLVFASKVGTAIDPSHVRRDFRNAIKDTEGVDPADWTPRALRHSFVSLLSDNGLPLEEISRLVGHSSTAVTEAVYRKQIRPVLQPEPWLWIASLTRLISEDTSSGAVPIFVDGP
ncbi:tyrosine-type recombinase/integrase [Acrocarpospora catenulata]|uniref:tyrosine-type recombinase/integrase n=1 Tax=Acrocarpospora catenulata TaxID=2836182 RepID=UPI0027DFD82E|nr:tyrosine-type recombinase/integrase [Acrocarpospora catenulata]